MLSNRRMFLRSAQTGQVDLHVMPVRVSSELVGLPLARITSMCAYVKTKEIKHGIVDGMSRDWQSATHPYGAIDY